MESSLYSAETGDTERWLADFYVGSLKAELTEHSFAGKTVLDFGAGSGVMAEALRDAGAHVIAVEPYGYESLSRHKKIQAYKSLAEAPERFDGVVAIEVIEHLENPWITLSELSSRLNNQGWLFLTTPNASGFNALLKRGSWREARKPGHLFLVEPRHVEIALAEAGFSVSRRLFWPISWHHHGTARKILDSVLQISGLDGGLRYLAWK